MKLAILTLTLLPAGAPSPAPRPTPTPPAAPTIEGVVRGPSGAPVKNAQIAVRPRASDLSDPELEPPLTFRTDTEGRFHATLRSPEAVEVTVAAEGLAPKRLDIVRAGARIDVWLDSGRFLAGTVRDARSDEPVAGARIVASSGRFESRASPSPDTREARSDVNGRFRVEGLGVVPVTLTVLAPGYARAERSSVRAGSYPELLLLPGVAIRGVVTGPDGKGLPGAQIFAQPDVPSRRPPRPEASSGDDGRYEIQGVSPSTYRVFAQKAGVGTSPIQEVTVDREAGARVDLRLGRSADLLGRLVAEDLKPVSGHVAVVDLDGLALASLAEVMRADAGADGRFHLEDLPSGSIGLWMSAPGFAPKRVEAVVEAEEPGAVTEIGDVELVRGVTIRGRVVDETGQGVAGAAIQAMFHGTAEGVEARATTEPDGAFILAGLEEGHYALTVSATGYGTERRDVESGVEGLRVILLPSGSITGQVVEESGGPVDVFSVSTRTDSRGALSFARSPRIVESTDGRFTIDDLPGGTYLVEVSAQSRRPGSVKDVAVRPGATTDVGRIRLDAGGTIRGVVVDERGAPVASASVFAMGPGRGSGQRSENATSDLDGAFELQGTPLGAMGVYATHPDFATGVASALVVDPATGPATVRIVMSAGGRIEGHLLRRDGTGVPGFYVQVQPRDSGLMARWPNDFVAVSPLDGSFVAEHVPPGGAEVRLLNRVGDNYSVGRSQMANVVEGETTDVEFRFRDVLVSGRVTKGGEPLPGARVCTQEASRVSYTSGSIGVSAPTGPQRGYGTTARDGSYALIVSEPGRAFFDVASANLTRKHTFRTLEVPDTDTLTVDFAVGGASVSGVVIDADTGEPIPRAAIVARAKNGDGSVSADTGADGRFAFDAEAGAYALLAYARGHLTHSQDVSVGPAGIGDLKIALIRGRQTKRP